MNIIFLNPLLSFSCITASVSPYKLVISLSNLLSDETPPEVQFFRKSGGGWVLDGGEVDLRVVQPTWCALSLAISADEKLVLSNKILYAKSS